MVSHPGFEVQLELPLSQTMQSEVFSPAHFAHLQPEQPATPPEEAMQHEPQTVSGQSDAGPTSFPTSSSSSHPQHNIPREPHNDSQALLQPWTCKGTRIFLDICSGDTRPLSVAVESLGLPALSIDLLLDARMDILHDPFYEQLLRLCGSGVIGYSAASPSCTEYSLLKLMPGGPRAIRTPEMMDGIPDLTADELLRLQNSALLLARCVQAISCAYTAGGHGHLEQPSGAMSWREPTTKNWLLLANCSLILLAACGFDWDIKKTWLFASSFSALAAMAVVCEHPAGSHQSIAGVKDSHGIYLSRRSAAYPAKLANQFAQIISVLLSPSADGLDWNSVFSFFPKKGLHQDPKSFVDGGGLVSTPDWSQPPPGLDNMFRPIRDHWIPKILHRGLHKQIVGHFQQQRTEAPFSDELIQEFRESLNSLLPIPEPLDWRVRDDQPLCLHALHSISRFMGDPDTELFPALIEGVSTGYHDSIAPSNVFSPKIPDPASDRPDLSVHWTNWQTAEDQPELTAELVQAEIDKDWLICFDGTLDDAKSQFPLGVAVGKLAIATSDSRPPRLVVDFTVSGTNHNCDINEHQQLPSAKEVIRTYPLRCNNVELGALGLDVKAAHKLCVLHPTHRGLVGFSFRNKLYFYKVCPFGAKFSAWWWGRLGSFFTRFLHQLIYIAHALFLFVDDYLLVQRLDVLPITAALISLVVQSFQLPISWRKADLGREVLWIGWIFNFSQGTVRLQSSKRDKLLKLIQELLERPKTSRKAIERFLGLALWITQLFPVMRAFLHHLYADLYKAPGTSYSIDPGFWLTTISCLNNNLQFTSRPIGTAIPEGGKLLSVRHQPVSTISDVQNCRLSEKRIWVRIMDPLSTKRTLSKDSQRILQMYKSWLQFTSPVMSMNPKPIWEGEAAADACADQDHCQIGGFLRFTNGTMLWFSERWKPKDFLDLDIPISQDMQRDISSYETLAQIALLYVLCKFFPAQRFPIVLRSQSDNTGAEASSNSMFTTKVPLCFFVERLCLLTASVHAHLDVSHIPGYANELADRISRLNLDQDIPIDLQASERIRLPLNSLWHPSRKVEIFPKGCSLSWPVPG